jgi:hypothetical protein
LLRSQTSIVGKKGYAQSVTLLWLLKPEVPGWVDMMEVGIITFVILASLSTAIGLLFSYICFISSRLPYNELGRHYDGQVVWLEQAALGYGVVAVFFFLVGLVSFVIHTEML